MGSFKKYVTCIMVFFTPFKFVTLCQFYSTEAVARRCPVKKAFLAIWQNSLKNTCARVPFLIKLQT